MHKSRNEANTDSGLKAVYCSSKLLNVQKRWPAKTFLVGDTATNHVS